MMIGWPAMRAATLAGEYRHPGGDEPHKPGHDVEQEDDIEEEAGTTGRDTT